MKKLINGADTLLAESLAGFASAHADLVCLGEDGKFVRRKFGSRGSERRWPNCVHLAI